MKLKPQTLEKDRLIMTHAERRALYAELADLGSLGANFPMLVKLRATLLDGAHGRVPGRMGKALDSAGND